VFGVDHPYMGRIALPDGEVTEPTESQLHSPAEVVAYYAKDLEFVIGLIAELNRANPERTFTGKFDMARIAAIGHCRCQRCLQAGFQNKGLQQYRRARFWCERSNCRLRVRITAAWRTGITWKHPHRHNRMQQTKYCRSSDGMWKLSARTRLRETGPSMESLRSSSQLKFFPETAVSWRRRWQKTQTSILLARQSKNSRESPPPNIAPDTAAQ
jgi:hypothetical protein